MQPSRIHHVGLPVSDLDLSVAWCGEALGLTHDSTAGVPAGTERKGRHRHWHFGAGERNLSDLIQLLASQNAVHQRGSQVPSSHRMAGESVVGRRVRSLS
jgi:hypothetical protein